LGRRATGSGYCVGIVVESRMGTDNTPYDENGLDDLWVLGEPFFRDCQVAFDAELSLRANVYSRAVEGEES
jgi:hypothetical protein